VKGSDLTDSIELGTNAGIYNLLDYQNGISTLIGSDTLTVDTITDIRLILGPNNTVKVDGEIFDLDTPSAQQSGLKIKVCIPLVDYDTYDLTLDFVAEESVFQTGNGQYKLRPRIKVVNDDAVCEDDDDDDSDDDDDDDDSDDDDDIDYGDLPQTIVDYLTANHPDAIVDDVEMAVLCDSVSYYTVSLEDEVNGDVTLYFDTDGNLAQEAIRIQNADLPQAVLESLEANYPDNHLAGNKSWLYESEGTTLYLLKLNANIRVVMDAEGNIICEI